MESFQQKNARSLSIIRMESLLKNCPDGLHFNAEIFACDWPENVNAINMHIIISN